MFEVQGHIGTRHLGPIMSRPELCVFAFVVETYVADACGVVAKHVGSLKW